MYVLYCAYSPSHWLFVILWNVAHQAPLSIGILQARILEWVAKLPFRGSSQPRDRTQVCCTAGGFFTVWATMEAQEYWSGWPVPSPGDLPNPGINPGPPALQVDSLPFMPYLTLLFKISPDSPLCKEVSQSCLLAFSSKSFPVKLLFSVPALFYYFLFYTLNSSNKELLWSPECTTPEF